MDGGERINREEGGMGTVIFIYYSSVMVDFLILKRRTYRFNSYTKGQQKSSRTIGGRGVGSIC